MEQQKAAALLGENLKALFAFSLANMYDKSEAEDLTHDIVCAVLESVHRLQDDGAFYGFMWKVAENTFRTRIRKKQYQTVPYDEGFVGAYWQTPESEYIKGEELRLLRRELSLLSKQYRDVTVAYYIHGKSCSAISQDCHISVEMVKYYLFKTRKILKEGLEMTREYGEKSYAPGVFRMDFWGDRNTYWPLFRRKLPGNILLAAYEKPLTLQELSVELGVSVAYLEDEVEILLSHDILRKTKDGYQTNIVIFTDEYEKAVVKQFRPLHTEVTEKLMQSLDACLPKLKTLEFQGNHYDDNRLKWAFINLIAMYALDVADERGRQRFGEYPPLSNGGHGFVFGYDNDYLNHHFNGIYGHCENRSKTAYFSVENYCIIQRCQQWEPVKWEASIEAMCDAILERPADEDNEQVIRLIGDGVIASHEGKLVANFPVFSEELVDVILFDMFKPSAQLVADCMEAVCEIAARELRGYVPQALRDKCDQLAFIHHQMDVMAFVVETMVEQGYLTVPDKKECLCIFGVKR